MVSRSSSSCFVIFFTSLLPPIFYHGGEGKYTTARDGQLKEGEKEMSQDNRKHMSGPVLDIEEIIAQQERMMKIICAINAVTLVCQVLLLLLKLTGQWSW